jgi:hypothetical protein
MRMQMIPTMAILSLHTFAIWRMLPSHLRARYILLSDLRFTILEPASAAAFSLAADARMGTTASSATTSTRSASERTRRRKRRRPF